MLFIKDLFERPIIRSLLDIDFYKFTMGQLVFNRYPDVPVTYAFRNRTVNVRLADILDLGELKEELDLAMTLRFTKSEIHYLRGTNEYQERMFDEKYLEFLSDFQLPPYDLWTRNGQICLEFSGKWSEMIYWETIALSIINELYYQYLVKKLGQFGQNSVVAAGQLRLREKIERLKEKTGITFTDFGTRRRFCRAWQDYVIESLVQEFGDKQFLGTSNTYLAMKHDLLPTGTSAHELFVVMSGIMGETDEGILACTNQVLKDWWEQYGRGLSIALTDTFGTNFFFKNMSAEDADKWKGLRQDSGNPIIFGERAIEFYRVHGIDPSQKLIVFSDGLDVDKIIALAETFSGRIKTTFGWGTNLTNDLGFKALSLVVKIVRANGQPVAKLSDNLAKAIGGSATVERYKKIFGYASDFSEECRY